MTQTLSKVERIETKIDNKVTQQLAVSGEVGGLAFKNMDEVMNFAKLMAISDVAVPKHIRENVGACLAVCIQAIEWHMSPYAVANKSYVVNDRLCFESQLVHAVIEQRAPIQGRLRNRYTGEGESRRCVVWATPKGETEALEYQSPETGRITPKNSPLWKSKPDLQLFYNASRDWARMYYPDVIMGVYTEDELDGAPQMSATKRSPVAMPKALDEGRTIDHGTSQIDPEPNKIAAHGAAGDPTPPQTGEQVLPPPVARSDAAAPSTFVPTSTIDISTWASFKAAWDQAAMDWEVPPSEADKILGLKVKAIKKTGHEEDISIESRIAWLKAAQSGAVFGRGE